MLPIYDLAGQLYPWTYTPNVIFSDSIIDDNSMLVLGTTVIVWMIKLNTNENADFSLFSSNYLNDINIRSDNEVNINII